MNQPPDSPPPTPDPHTHAPPEPWAPPTVVVAGPGTPVPMPAATPATVFSGATLAPATSTADAVAAQRAAHFALPAGWVPCPVERRPLYTGRRCPDPLRGLLLTRDAVQRIYIVRATLATRCLGYADRLVDVRVGDEVVVLEDLDLIRLQPLLLRQDVWVEVDIREPRLLERRDPRELDVYAYTLTVNPVMVPRT